MKNFRTYIEQVVCVLSRFTDAAIGYWPEETFPKWIETRFGPVLIGEWISLGVWNPTVATFLWKNDISPAHLLDDRVPPALVEAACSGESSAMDIVRLFFGGYLETKNVEAVARGYAERIDYVLSHFTDEALRGQRGEMTLRWICTGFDPVLVAGWLSVGVWNPEVADELWNQGVSPDDVFDYQIPRDLVEEVCAGQRDPEDVTELVW